MGSEDFERRTRRERFGERERERNGDLRDENGEWERIRGLGAKKFAESRGSCWKGQYQSQRRRFIISYEK